MAYATGIIGDGRAGGVRFYPISYCSENLIEAGPSARIGISVAPRAREHPGIADGCWYIFKTLAGY